jgi:hypothetical protein
MVSMTLEAAKEGIAVQKTNGIMKPSKSQTS